MGSEQENGRQSMAWESWLQELKAEFERVFGVSFDDTGYDTEGFREMYDDGLNPQEAIEEEADAARWLHG